MSITRKELGEQLNLDLISSHKIEGTPVFNADNEHLGHIEHLMIDKQSGQVAYAIMSFGGFLGIGEEYHPLPWDVLKYNPELDSYDVDLSKEELESAPRFKHDNQPDWSDRAYAQAVFGHYHVTPYWGPL